MGSRGLSASEVRGAFPGGTVMHNPVTGEYARVIEHTAERAVGELLAVPGGAVAGPHSHPGQEERFEVVAGVLGYRLPPELFAAMIGAVWGLAVVGRTNAKGMPKLLDAALLAEAFADEIVFERPPRVVQRALAVTVAPIARRRGRTVTGDVMRSAVVPPGRWPDPGDPGTVTSG